jgi:catechol 2,3-dioxygenase-like lactoylglutathione lyase family enzyme
MSNDLSERNSSSASPRRIRGLFHAGITVRDMKRALTFYGDLLGLEVQSDVRVVDPWIFRIAGVKGKAIRIVYLRVPESAAFIELLEYEGVRRRSGRSLPSDPGSGHVCLFVDDVDRLHERLLESGFSARSESSVEVVAGSRVVGKVVYAVDPDGYNVELFERQPRHQAP